MLKQWHAVLDIGKAIKFFNAIIRTMEFYCRQQSDGKLSVR